MGVKGKRRGVKEKAMKKRKWAIVAAGCAAAVAAVVIIVLLAKKAPPAIDTPAYWLDRAEREAESISGKSVAGWRFFEIAEVRAEGGDVEGAMAMRERVVVAEPGVFSRAANAVRDILADIGIAKPRAPRQQRPGVTEKHFLASIAMAQARRGDVRGAEATAAKAALASGDDYSTALARSEIAKAQARAGDYAGAMATAKLVREDYLPYAQNVASQLMAALHAEAGNTDAARAAVQALGEYERFWICSDVAVILGRRGNKQGYEMFMRLMEEAGNAQDREKFRNHVNLTISLTCARAGDMQGAKAAIEQIADPGRFDMCHDAACECLWEGNEQAARFYWQMVLDEAQKAGKSDVQWAIAGARAGLGDIDGAIAIAEQIPPKEGRDAESRIRIAMAMAAAGRFAELEKWIDRIHDADHRSEACVNAAREIIRREAEAKKAAQKKK